MDFQGNLIIDSSSAVRDAPGQLTTSFPAELYYSHDEFTIGLKELHFTGDWHKFRNNNYFVIYNTCAPSQYIARVVDIEKKDVFRVINNQLLQWKTAVKKVDVDP